MLEWSAAGVEELRSELEWLRPNRKTGSVLARLAYDRMRSSKDSEVSVHSNFPYAYDTVATTVVAPYSPTPLRTDNSDTSFAISHGTASTSSIGMDWFYAPIDNSFLENYECSDDSAFADNIQGSSYAINASFDG